MIDETAIVQSSKLDESCIVCQFVVIKPNVEIGSDSVINAHAYIDSKTVIGTRVIVGSGARISSGVALEDDVYVGPNVIVGDDDYLPDGKVVPTIIRQGAWVCGNSVLLSGINIGAGARIGAGSVVTSDVQANAVVVGNPARIVGYVGTEEKQTNIANTNGVLETPKVKGVRLFRLQNVRDLRGDLSAIEWEKQLPFTPKRAFFVYNVTNSSVRGEHAHKICHQFLLCVHGTVSVVVDDGNYREEFRLNEPHIGIYIPPGVWGIQYKSSSDAVLFVLASHEYDPDDYIRDYNEYLTYLES